MVGLIVCTHGRFSEELVRTSEMMFGKQENLQCITFESGENVDGLVEKYKNALQELNSKDGILLLVDLFGGSPYNSASIIAAKNPDIDIVTGVNLPMLLEVYAFRSSLGLHELVNTAVKAGINAVKSFGKIFNTNVGEEEL